MLSSKCVCYSKFLSPYESCNVPASESTSQRRRRLDTVSTTTKKTSVKCICPFDSTYGFFKQITTLHQYGRQNPPICDQCAAESLGPKPQENPAGSFTKPCTIYGNYDANYANITLAWRPCSDHGAWNGTACVCNRGWQLGDALTTYNSSVIIKSCDQCDYNYGPLVEANAVGAPFCNKIYTPDDHGVPKECGGFGVFLYGQCQCQHGYSLTTFQNVQTCL